MELLNINYKDQLLTFRGPSSWNELTPKEYLTALRFLWNYSGQLAYGLVLLATLYKVPLQIIDTLDEEETAIELERLRFLFGNELNKWILKKLGPDSYKKKWFLPYSFARKYHGPDDQLSSLTFAEFMHAENYFSKYDLTKNEQFLNGLIAILYRPKASKQQFLVSGDHRTAFNPNDVAKRSNKLSRLENDVKQAILFNYAAVRLHFASLFPNVFETPDQDQSQATKENREQTGSWLDIGLSLARKERALGDFKDLEKTNVYLVLKVLDSVIKEYKEQQEYLERIKKHD